MSVAGLTDPNTTYLEHILGESGRQGVFDFLTVDIPRLCTYDPLVDVDRVRQGLDTGGICDVGN